jgi:HD-GYP domain-containing protein (c-di-GMP phosphodiesterase class II)
MLSQKVKSRLRRRLQDTRLRQLIAREIVALLADKPEEVKTEDYCMAVAELVVLELKARLCKPFEERPLDQTEQAAAEVSQSLGEDAASEVPPPAVAASVADQTANLDAIIKRLTSGVEHALLAGNLQMLRALGEAIAQRDTGTSKHNPRVTLYSIRLAEHMGLDTDQVQALIKGSFLHDIGKIGIRDDIILKPAGLTDEERRIMNSHPQLGSMIISSVKWLEDARDVVRYHHERWDGKGYPDGLKGEKIPLNARIFAVVDVFDALTSDRPYKSAQSFDEVMAILREHKGSQFDPKVVEAFEEIARGLYDEFTAETFHGLDEKLRHAMETHFGTPTPIPL